METEQVNTKPDRLVILILLCLTLGLAPFTPEPHIWGKIKWIMGGAVGMAAIDWFDFVLHGLPWALIIVFLTKKLAKSLSFLH